jgi:hypothetical protein
MALDHASLMFNGERGGEEPLIVMAWLCSWYYRKKRERHASLISKQAAGDVVTHNGAAAPKTSAHLHQSCAGIRRMRGAPKNFTTSRQRGA